MNRVNKININIKLNNIIKEKKIKNETNEENLNNTIVKYSNNNDDNDDNDNNNDDDIIAPFSNHILNNIYVDNGINELKVIQCNNCSCKYCFPIEFDKELKYYDFRLPFKNNSINYICNSCFQDFLKKDVKIKCICGIKYQRNETKFINNHYSNNTIHLLFKKDKELFYNLYDKFNKNIYNLNTNELKTIIDNYNIEIKYHKKITNLCLLELLLNYLKNIDLSTIQINKNIYSVNINMSNKELYNIIHEYNLNIRNIHSIKKKILIKKINEKLEEIYS